MGNPYDIADDDPEYQALLKQYGVGAPQAPQQEAGFKSAFKNALGSQVQGAGQIAADLGWQDNPIERYGKSVQDANPMSIRSLGDIVESPWQATKEATGMALGYIAPAMLGRGLQVAGGAMKLAGLSKAGVALNTLPAQAALAAVPSYGGIREEQEAGGHNDLADIGTAALGAGTVGAIETKFGAQKMLGLGKGAVAAPTRAEFVKGLGKTPLATMGKVMGRTVAEEMGEELAQNPIEQLASYQNPLTAENINETLTGSALAGLGTIGLGGVGGARMGMRHNAINNFRQQDLLNPNTPLDMLNDQVEWNKAFIERDDGATAADRFYRQRQGEIDQYIESLVDPYRREAFADDMRQIDLLADQERIAARAPSVLGRVSDYNPDDERVANAVDRPNAADYLNWWEGVPDPTNPEAYQQFWQHVTDGTDSVRPVQRDALGYPLSPYQPVSATQPQTSAPSWTQYGVEPTVNQGGANVIPQVAQGSNQGPRGNTGGSAGTVGLGDNSAGQRDGLGRTSVAPAGPGGTAGAVGNASGGVGAVTARPGTKDALKQMAVQLAPEGSQEYVDLVNAIDTSKSYAEARKSLAKHSKDGLRLAIATAPEQDRKTLQLALGWDNEGNMVGSTIPSYSEIGKQIGKTRQRVQQILSQYGITEQVLNQMAAVGQESVGLSEIMPSQQEDGGQHEGTGYRLMTNPNEADDIVDDHQTRKDTQEANRVAAEMGVSAKELSQPSNFQTAAEVRAEEIAQANREAHAAKEREAGAREMEKLAKVEKETLLDLLRKSDPNIVEEDIRNAREEWSLGGAEALVPFDNLTTSEQASFVRATVSFYTTDSSMTAQRYANRLEEILDEAGKRTRSETQAVAPVRNEAGEAALGPASAAEEVVQPVGSESSSEEVTAEGVVSRWNQGAKALGVTTWDGLSSEQQNYILGSGTWEEFDEAAGEVLDEINDDQGAAKFSESNTDKGVDPQKLSTTLRKLFFSPEKFNKLVSIYPDAASIPLDVKEAAAADAHMSVKDVPWEHVQGFAMNGKVYLVAGNIKEGNELGVFLHELGVHVGMERLIGKSNMAKLSNQIEQWAANDNGSKESKLAKDAVRRAEGSASEDRQQEVIAYFVEEAVKSGINPVAIQKTNSPLAQWFRSLWAAAKLALRKIGLGRFDQLSAQNIVDLSYGAAKMELTGTWHGTAADFRNFNHSYMGSGEGAQAFGWGTYLAQRVGIAKGYWKDDVRRKTRGTGDVGVNGVRYTDAEFKSELQKEGVSEEVAELVETALSESGGNEVRAMKWLGNMLGKGPTFSRENVNSALDAMLLVKELPKPEGSLMRVDTAVHDDEMLDWDKPLSEQSKARIALMPLRKFLAHTADELTGGANWNDMTGEEMYHLVQRALQQDYFDPNLPKVDEALRQGKTDKAASEYLDSIGIKGIKFLDSQSRSNNNYKVIQDNGRFFILKVLSSGSTSDIIGSMTGYATEAEAKSVGENWKGNQTRNLVIFNDKNIQRVASQVGADRDKVKFSFAGKNAETADPAKLSKAESLEKAGVDQQSIWEQTGWYRGADDAWRFEISDNNASFVNDGATLSDVLGGSSKKLGVVLNHPELFKAYPKLRSIDVSPVAKSGHGKYSSNNGYPKINLDPSMPSEEALSVLMHEVQHAIQDIENFARGGNPAVVAADMAERNELLAEVGSALNDAVTGIRSEFGADAYRELTRKVRDDGFRYSHVAFQLGTLDEDAIDVADIVHDFAKAKGYDNVVKAAEAYIEIADTLVQPGSSIDKETRAFELYQRLAGEVEARNVQTRLGQTLKVNPRATEDTATERQIVKFSGESSSSAKFSQADVTRINPQYRQASTLVKQVLEYVGNKFQSVENNLMFGHQLAEKLQRLMPGTDSYIKSLQKRQTERVKHEQEIARIASAYNELDTKQQNALNAFVQKSTMDGKWGFKPTWFEKDVQTAVDATMKTQFDALTPAAQQIVKDMFKFGSEQQKRFDESVNANITDPKKKVQRNQMYGKPYAPLKRFGDHVVVGKSAAFVAEEKANPGSKRLAEMKADPKHYYVEFTDGNWEAIKRRDEMASANPALSWLSKPLQLEDGDLVGMNFTMLEKLKRQIEASDSKSSKATKSALSSLANQLYIQQLNHLHANKSQAQRLNVKGADTDMMRAFVTQGRAEAALIANLRTHAETEKALQQIQTAAREGSNQDAKTRVANAVLRRHLAMLDFKPTPIQNKLMGANSFMMLLTSPAYYLTNATQPFVVSLPYMAGRFGGANSWNTLRDAYKTTLELVKLPTLFKDQNLDTAHLRKFNSIGREADALQTLLDENLVNVGMEMELGDIANQSKNPAWKHVQKGMQVLKTGVANVEILNRLSSAVAGYRLAYTEAINKGQSTDAAHDAGVEYARKLVIDTHGDYAGYNAPTVMMQGAFGNLPVKLMTQFKKFQFIQAGLLIGTFRDAYLRGNLNPTEKAAAKAMFKWMLGTQAALAGALGGVTGVPMALLGSILAGAFGDDGEDKEAFLRRVLGGGAFAQLILHGAPAAAGVDISKRVGMGAALDPFRMADPQTDWSDYALSLAGPSAGLASRTANGLSYMGKGQYWKGLEMLMPSGVLTNASKIARYESEGLTNSRGDVVMKPEEISLMTDIMQGMGLETTQLSDRRWKAGAVYDRGIHFKEQTAKLQRDYVEAIKDGDQGEVSEIRQKWMKLQAERVKQGFKRENMTALTQAPMAQKKRERDTINGLQSTQTNKKFVESIDAL